MKPLIAVALCVISKRDVRRRELSGIRYEAKANAEGPPDPFAMTAGVTGVDLEK
jgi:hypothetical protein